MPRRSLHTDEISYEGLKINGTAYGSSEYVTLGPTEVDCTIDTTLINYSGSASQPINVLDLTFIQLFATSDLRIAKDDNDTDDNANYWFIPASTMYAFPLRYIIATSGTFRLRTDVDSNVQLFYGIPFSFA